MVKVRKYASQNSIFGHADNLLEDLGVDGKKRRYVHSFILLSSSLTQGRENDPLSSLVIALVGL
jgi:hypothetical protein